MLEPFENEILCFKVFDFYYLVSAVIRQLLNKIRVYFRVFDRIKSN